VSRVVVCREDELPPGQRRILRVDGREIGVLNVAGRFYAVRNRCPHQGAELCLGTVSGTMLPSDPGQYRWGLDDRVLRCPWHGWEFDLENGEKLFDPIGRVRVKTYPVTVENGEIVLDA
jgi:3-phenylpropionate/trans-cinnamate dioxygenase ferredoxin subunit